MPNRYAKIENETVVNVALFDDAPDPKVFGDDWIPCPDNVGKGWARAGGEFVAPEGEEEPGKPQ